MASKTKAKKRKTLTLAERQEGRGVGDCDVRGLAGGQRAELFGADLAPEKKAPSITLPKAWSTYGGRVGVWRILRMLERLKKFPPHFSSMRDGAELYIPTRSSRSSSPASTSPRIPTPRTICRRITRRTSRAR